MKQILAICAVVLLSGCVNANIEDVRSDGCAWVRPILLSDASIQALREAQKTHPEVRQDREKIVKHDILWFENCEKDK